MVRFHHCRCLGDSFRVDQLKLYMMPPHKAGRITALFLVFVFHSSRGGVLVKRQGGFGKNKPQIWSGPYPCFDKNGAMKFGQYLAVGPKPSSTADCCVCKPYEPLKWVAMKNLQRVLLPQLNIQAVQHTTSNVQCHANILRMMSHCNHSNQWQAESIKWQPNWGRQISKNAHNFCC